jgi:hypothetical protein
MSAERDAHIKLEQALRIEIEGILLELDRKNYSSKSEKTALNKTLLEKRREYQQLRLARPKSDG